jgi:hypothetical protein
MAPRAQLFAQFRVVIDFAVEGKDCVTVFAMHGLVAACEVDDAEAHGSDGNRL